MWMSMAVEIMIYALGTLVAMAGAILAIGSWQNGNHRRAIQVGFLSIALIVLPIVSKIWIKDLFHWIQGTGIGLAFLLAILIAIAGRDKAQGR